MSWELHAGVLLASVVGRALGRAGTILEISVHGLAVILVSMAAPPLGVVAELHRARSAIDLLLQRDGSCSDIPAVIASCAQLVRAAGQQIPNGLALSCRPAVGLLDQLSPELQLKIHSYCDSAALARLSQSSTYYTDVRARRRSLVNVAAAKHLRAEFPQSHLWPMRGCAVLQLRDQERFTEGWHMSEQSVSAAIRHSANCDQYPENVFMVAGRHARW